jgi:hypothetical protein
MAAGLWLTRNWFAVFQAIGIAGGLLFTALSIRRETNHRRLSDLLSLSEHHRVLWSELQHKPELLRILDWKVDLIGSPVKAQEAQFLNLVFVHFETGWRLAKKRGLPSLKTLTNDVADFFARPIPRMVWENTKSARDPGFVEFVDKCLVRMPYRNVA